MCQWELGNFQKIKREEIGARNTSSWKKPQVSYIHQKGVFSEAEFRKKLRYEKAGNKLVIRDATWQQKETPTETAKSLSIELRKIPARFCPLCSQPIRLWGPPGPQLKGAVSHITLGIWISHTKYHIPWLERCRQTGENSKELILISLGQESECRQHLADCKVKKN